MRKKGLLMLALWYLWWIAIAMKYSKKNASETKKSVEKTWSFFDVFVENVAAIHKDIFCYLEQKIGTEENKKLIKEYKEKTLAEIEKFKKEATVKIEELKKEWIIKKAEIEKELKKIYNEREEYLDKALDIGKEYSDDLFIIAKKYLDDWKAKLDKEYKKIKAKIK